MGGLKVSSPCFDEGGLVPVEHTGYGADVSPALVLDGLDEGAVSLVVMLDDEDHPIRGYSHWVLWNVPARASIPGSVPAGKRVESLGGAVQGRGYGRNRYRGPKPPFNWSHRYRFTVYALDCLLDLPPTARKRDVLTAMDGHVLQRASLTCRYR